MEKNDRTKGKRSELGEAVKLVHSDSFPRPFIFRDKDAPFPQVKGGHLSQEGFWSASGEDQKILPKYAVPQIPSAWNYQHAKLPYLGVASPESHKCHVKGDRPVFYFIKICNYT